MLSGAIEHLSGDSTDPYLENDLSTLTEATGVVRYALADAVSFGSRFSTERQKEVTSSGSDSRAAISMYACHSSAAHDRDAMTFSYSVKVCDSNGSCFGLNTPTVLKELYSRLLCALQIF